MSNIRFNYLFRDPDNYKLFGGHVLSNEQCLRISAIAALIKPALIDGKFFYPSAWNLPLLYSEDGWGMEETDWCEFEGVEETNDEVTGGSIMELLNRIEQFS